ncbi:hypothetical protein ISF_00083 [Cordyceps fumosorosea ARSEF 2679]|uniref:Uncharacterized protein n=1 Tax=Cordyceps fumosorosea (strain ARSEF 2679) TaxID=1081104 RepID=A0A162JSQ2_CORFA|nr:hypothetical protein ISF_00083 [Cordyceps fumosorosea ARSEF 2679]OAA73182.1 hypothetical protein ISF_00083 [Cordyceps fumosorosea ARSEF 2679]
MISMMLWTALSLSAATTHGAVVPRQDGGDFDLAGVILQSTIVQRHLTSTKKFMGKEFPYSEGQMEASKNALGATFKDNYDHLAEKERKCLYVRNSFSKEATQSFFDVVPNVDAPDTITEDKPKTGTISTSKAIINTERHGWNKEESSEIGGSVTVGVQSGISFFSASLSATIFGNQRTAGGKHGEASKQTEYTVTNTEPYECPENSICRHITWTYTRTLRGKCFTTPYYDAQCSNSQHSKNKFDLALFGLCSPSSRFGKEFYTFNDTAVDSTLQGELNNKITGYGPDNQGIKMPKPEIIASRKFEEDCTFTYVLRDKSGNPVRAMASIIERDNNPLIPQVKVTKVPKAVKWVAAEDGKKMCELENGWYWMPGDQWYIPPADEDSPDEWVRRAELPEPVDLKKNCPKNGKVASKRALSGRALPPPNNLGEDPADDLVEMKIIQDDMPAFIKELEESNSEGFVANTVDEKAQLVRREGWTYWKTHTFENCLGQSIKQNGKA